MLAMTYVRRSRKILSQDVSQSVTAEAGFKHPSSRTAELTYESIH